MPKRWKPVRATQVSEEPVLAMSEKVLVPNLTFEDEKVCVLTIYCPMKSWTWMKGKDMLCQEHDIPKNFFRSPEKLGSFCLGKDPVMGKKFMVLTSGLVPLNALGVKPFDVLPSAAILAATSRHERMFDAWVSLNLKGVNFGLDLCWTTLDIE